MPRHDTAFERHAPSPALVDRALAPTRDATFWLEDAGTPAAYPPLRGPAVADLLVVGGGFVEASLTHGEANGRSRWPEEYDELDRLGTENLDAFEADVTRLGLDCGFTRTGQLSVAVEQHQVEWLPAAGRLDAHSRGGHATRAVRQAAGRVRPLHAH